MPKKEVGPAASKLKATFIKHQSLHSPESESLPFLFPDSLTFPNGLPHDLPTPDAGHLKRSREDEAPFAANIPREKKLKPDDRTELLKFAAVNFRAPFVHLYFLTYIKLSLPQQNIVSYAGILSFTTRMDHSLKTAAPPDVLFEIPTRLDVSWPYCLVQFDKSNALDRNCT